MYEAGNPKPVFCDNLEGWGGEGCGLEGKRTYVHPALIHVDVWQKPSQYCKVNYPLIQTNKQTKTNKQKT